MRIEVIGSLNLVDDDLRRSSPGGRSTRLVLSHLVARRPEPVPSDRLIDGAWGSSRLATPDATLRMTISRLRRLLGATGPDPKIIRRAGGYRLSDSVQVDAHRFDRLMSSSRQPNMTDGQLIDLLTEALALWRGDPYPDAEWGQLLAERQRLIDLRLDAVQRLQTAAIRVGRPELGAVQLRSASDDVPLHEGLTALRMRTLYATGHHPQALREYDQYRKELSDELGVEPGPDLRDLQAAILRHEVEPRPEDADRETRETPAREGRGPTIGWVVGSSLIDTPAPWDDNDLDHLDRLAHRGDISAALGHWDSAADAYLLAVEKARAVGDQRRAAEYCLRLARSVWDPSLGATAAQHLAALRDQLGSGSLRARLELCLAGGLHRDGTESVGHDPAVLRAALEVVETSPDPVAVAWGLTHYRDALAGQLPIEQSVGISTRIADLDLDDPVVNGQNLRALFSGLLLSGRPARARHTLRAISTTGPEWGPVVNRFGLETATNCWNLAMGRWASVQAGLTRMLEYEGRLSAATFNQVVLGQSFWLSRDLADQPTLRAHLEGARALAAEDTSTPLWQVAAGVLALDIGDVAQALDVLKAASTVFDLSALPAGSHRVGILALTAEILGGAAAAGADVDRDLATTVLQRLEASDCNCVLFGWPTVFVGSKARFQAFAASAAGLGDLAARQAALAIVEDRFTPALQARSLVAMATVEADRHAAAEHRRHAERIVSGLHRRLASEAG